MMKTTRRSFIKNLMLGAGAFTLGPLFLSLKPLTASGQGDDNDFFVQGVIKNFNNDLFTIAYGNDDIVYLKVLPSANVWKGMDGLSKDVIKLGDFFYARGIRQGNTLTAVNLWVNIVSFSGSLSEYNSETDVLLVSDQTTKRPVYLNKNTDFFSGIEKTNSNILSKVKKGDYIHIIGEWVADTKSVKATRCFLPAVS